MADTRETTPLETACLHCGKPVNREESVCLCCGFPLYITCPSCGGHIFADRTCEKCGHPLTVSCTNKKCEAVQYYKNDVCNICRKKIKVRKK